MTVTRITPGLSADQHRYAVESGIPISPLKSSRAIYPFSTMQVGDSFALTENTLQEIERCRAAASYWGLRHVPQKFAVRMSNPAKREYRCWRIA